jgi:hypothetical protein
MEEPVERVDPADLYKEIQNQTGSADRFRTRN